LVALLELAWRSTDDFSGVFEAISEYDGWISKYLGKPLEACSVLEIGFGARPYLLLAMMSMGIRAAGVDLDRPVLRPSLKAYIRVARTNGAERALKTMVGRHSLIVAAGSCWRRRSKRAGTNYAPTRQHVHR